VSIVFHLLTHFHKAFPRRKVPFVYQCLWETKIQAMTDLKESMRS